MAHPLAALGAAQSAPALEAITASQLRRIEHLGGFRTSTFGAISPDGCYCVTIEPGGPNDRVLAVVRNTTTGQTLEPRIPLYRADGDRQVAALSAGARWLLCRDAVYEMSTGQQRVTLSGGSFLGSPIQALAVDPSFRSALVLIKSRNSVELRRCNLSTGVCEWSGRYPWNWDRSRNNVPAVAISPDGRYAAVDAGPLLLIDMHQNVVTAGFDCAAVWLLNFSLDGQSLIVASSQGVSIFAVPGGGLLYTNGRCRSLCLSRDNDLLFVVEDQGGKFADAISVRSVATGQPMTDIPVPAVFRVEISADGQRLIAGSEYSLDVWGIRSAGAATPRYCTNPACQAAATRPNARFCSSCGSPVA